MYNYLFNHCEPPNILYRWQINLNSIQFTSLSTLISTLGWLFRQWKYCQDIPIHVVRYIKTKKNPVFFLHFGFNSLELWKLFQYRLFWLRSLPGIFPLDIEKSHFCVFSLYVCTRWQGPLVIRLLFLTYLIEAIVHTGLALLYSKFFCLCGAPYPSLPCCYLHIVGNPGGACRLNPLFATIRWFFLFIDLL